ncbi:flagellar hook-length control protein FliK [Alphaproteobacteria bacterium]|nr:flagellar hook-length control protein FliK [Alphaproteobacteria bacterium]
MDVDLTQIVTATSKRMPAGRAQSMAASQTMLDAFAKTLTSTQDRQQDMESFIDRGTDNRSSDRHLSDRDVDSRHHDDRDNNGQDHRSRDRDDRDTDSNEHGSRTDDNPGAEDNGPENHADAADKTASNMATDRTAAHDAAGLDAGENGLAMAVTQGHAGEPGTIEAESTLTTTTATAGAVLNLAPDSLSQAIDTGTQTSIANAGSTDGTAMLSAGISAAENLRDPSMAAAGHGKSSNLPASGLQAEQSNQRPAAAAGLTTGLTQDLRANQAPVNPNHMARQLTGNANGSPLQTSFQSLSGDRNRTQQATTNQPIAVQTQPSDAAVKPALTSLQQSLSQNSSHPQTSLQMLTPEQTAGKQLPAMTELQTTGTERIQTAAAAVTSSQNPSHPQTSLHMLAVEQSALKQGTASAQPVSTPSPTPSALNPNSTAAQLSAGQDTQSSTQMLATAQNTTKQVNAVSIGSTAELTAATAHVRRASAGNPATTSAAAPRAADVASTGNGAGSGAGSAAAAAPAASMSQSASLTSTPISSLLKTAQTQAPQVIKQVTVEIAGGVKKGDTDIKIQLRPDQLGKVNVQLEIAKDGAVKALVLVDKAETLELLQRDSRGLERSLQDAGLKTGNGSLTFALNDQGQSGSGQSSQGQNNGGKPHHGTANTETTAATVETHEDQVEQPTIGADGMINMVA